MLRQSLQKGLNGGRFLDVKTSEGKEKKNAFKGLLCSKLHDQRGFMNL